jgi:hypothetical protein
MTYSSHWGKNGQYLPYWHAPRLGHKTKLLNSASFHKIQYGTGEAKFGLFSFNDQWKTSNIKF